MIACYLVNRSPSSGIDFKTPIEMWSGRAANYSDLKIFGCPSFAHVKQGKLEPRALKCVFLGYPEGVKGYRLWCTDLKPPRCIVSRDVIFNEQEMLKSYMQKLENSDKNTGVLRDQIKVELTGNLEIQLHMRHQKMRKEMQKILMKFQKNKQHCMIISWPGIEKGER